MNTLKLNLFDNSIGASGAQALAAQKDALSLHTPKLTLFDNSIGASGAQGLAARKDVAHPAAASLSPAIQLEIVVHRPLLH